MYVSMRNRYYVVEDRLLLRLFCISLLSILPVVVVHSWSSRPLFFIVANNNRCHRLYPFRQRQQQRRNVFVRSLSIPSSSSSSSFAAQEDSLTTSSSSSGSMSQDNNKYVPRISPLPPPIISTTVGSWAYDTMSRRIHAEILQRTYDDNVDMWTLPSMAPYLQQFQELQSQLQSSSPLQYLKEPSADVVTTTTTASSEQQQQEEQEEEWRVWNQLLRPYVERGDTWLTAPWIVSEFYVYRRLLQTIGYYDPSSPGYQWDPFLSQKRAGWESSIVQAEPLLQQIMTSTTTTTNTNVETSDELLSLEQGLAVTTSFSLWGNQADLSLWPVKAASNPKDKDNTAHSIPSSSTTATTSDYLLHDDLVPLTEYCCSLANNNNNNKLHVDIIVDNAGLELVTDLILAQYLITSNLAECVTFRLKSHPTFVSDAMEKDLRATVNYYATELQQQQQQQSSLYPYCIQAGQIWQDMLQSGQWKCQQDDFWVQPHAMWDMPNNIRQDFQQRCDLAIVKGDANYRRLLGDLQWPITTNNHMVSFEDVVGAYFPCPVLALRTLKSEVACGIAPEQVQRALQLHPKDWMVNGKFGVIQFSMGVPKNSNNTPEE